MDLKTRYVSNIYKMNDFTKSNNNHFINKYSKTLNELTWFSLPKAEDPLDIMKNEPIPIKPIVKEKPKEKPPTFIPNEIMRNILSYLPPPVIKAEEYGIMNNKYNDGYFMVIKRTTPKFVVYDRYKWYDNGQTILKLQENKRSKLIKDKKKREYYIVYNNEEFIVDNKLPVMKFCGYDLTETRFMTTPQYKNLLRENYYYSDNNYAPVNYYWFNRK